MLLAELILFVDIGDSLILQCFCFLFLLSCLLSALWVCQKGPQAEELRTGLKFAGWMLVVYLCLGQIWKREGLGKGWAKKGPL